MASTRVLSGVVDRARWRNTLMYRFTPSFQAGLEYNPRADELGPLVNWRLLEETGDRPAFIVGTSSDRIGTPSGRAYYATFSKDLQERTGLPVAPYFGASYGTYEDNVKPIGGLTIRYTEQLSSTHLHDGKAIHHMLGWDFGPGKPTLGLLWVDHQHLGFTASLGFSF